MASNDESLYKQFQPHKYILSIGPHEVSKQTRVNLHINGMKMPRPSKRITLHQKRLKIISAQIVQASKKGRRELEVIRINHLPNIEQVRLHASGLIYPGPCEITLEYLLETEKVAQFKKNDPSRELMPSIDEPEAWANATFEITA